MTFRRMTGEQLSLPHFRYCEGKDPEMSLYRRLAEGKTSVSFTLAERTDGCCRRSMVSGYIESVEDLTDWFVRCEGTLSFELGRRLMASALIDMLHR